MKMTTITVIIIITIGYILNDVYIQIIYILNKMRIWISCEYRNLRSHEVVAGE